MFRRKGRIFLLVHPKNKHPRKRHCTAFVLKFYHIYRECNLLPLTPYTPLEKCGAVHTWTTRLNIHHPGAALCEDEEVVVGVGGGWSS
jgi:hypothetical protein